MGVRNVHMFKAWNKLQKYKLLVHIQKLDSVYVTKYLML